ncbi:hypothetical protein ALC56_05561, partial [Trachymyrmex septentrionalis]
QELCIDDGDTESDGGLMKPVTTYLSTILCPCARLSHLFQATKNASSAISVLGINKGQRTF